MFLLPTVVLLRASFGWMVCNLFLLVYLGYNQLANGDALLWQVRDGSSSGKVLRAFPRTLLVSGR